MSAMIAAKSSTFGFFASLANGVAPIMQISRGAVGFVGDTLGGRFPGFQTVTVRLH